MAAADTNLPNKGDLSKTIGTSYKLSDGNIDMFQAVAVGAGYFGRTASSTEDAKPKPGERRHISFYD